MRLLIDVRALMDRSSGGVARVALELIKNYANRFPDDELVCATTGLGKPSLPDELSRLANIKHVHLNVPNKLWGLLSFLNAVSFIGQMEKRAGKIDAVFFPNLGFMGSCRKKDYTLLLHDLSFLIEPGWFSRKQRIWHRLVKAKDLMRGAKYLFAVSETTKRDTLRLLGILENRIMVIPLGPTSVVGARGARPEPTHVSNQTYMTNATTGRMACAPTKNRYVLAMGAGDSRKNTATAIQAVALLKQEPGFEDLELIIIDTSYAVRRTRYDAPWIHFSECPSDADIASLYANASAFLYPSWYEGYGLPLHEAASFGTPCVASTAGALPETAPDGTIFANPAKPHHWVEALKIALQKRNEPIQADAQAWQKAADVMREKIIVRSHPEGSPFDYAQGKLRDEGSSNWNS